MTARLPEMVGLSEIGEMAGVSRQRADQIMRHPDAPAGQHLRMGTVWAKADVAKFLAEPRRPVKHR
jgi:hypothetical protein